MAPLCLSRARLPAQLARGFSSPCAMMSGGGLGCGCVWVWVLCGLRVPHVLRINTQTDGAKCAPPRVYLSDELGVYVQLRRICRPRVSIYSLDKCAAPGEHYATHKRIIHHRRLSTPFLLSLPSQLVPTPRRRLMTIIISTYCHSDAHIVRRRHHHWCCIFKISQAIYIPFFLVAFRS